MSRPLRIEYPGACYHVLNREFILFILSPKRPSGDSVIIGLGAGYQKDKGCSLHTLSGK